MTDDLIKITRDIVNKYSKMSVEEFYLNLRGMSL